jgi:hypothetical protein
MPASATTITFSAVDVITGTIADCFVDDVGPTSAGVHSSGISAMCRRATTGRCHSTTDYSASAWSNCGLMSGMGGPNVTR